MRERIIVVSTRVLHRQLTAHDNQARRNEDNFSDDKIQPLVYITRLAKITRNNSVFVNFAQVAHVHVDYIPH